MKKCKKKCKHKCNACKHKPRRAKHSRAIPARQLTLRHSAKSAVKSEFRPRQKRYANSKVVHGHTKAVRDLRRPSY